jgi:hypothetical protein
VGDLVTENKNNKKVSHNKGLQKAPLFLARRQVRSQK